MASGAIYGSTSHVSVDAALTWSSVANVEARTSTVAVKLVIKPGISVTGTMYASALINGQMQYGAQSGINYDAYPGWRGPLYTWTFTVPHNADGTASVSFEVLNNTPTNFYTGIPNVFNETYGLSGTLVLDNIGPVPSYSITAYWPSGQGQISPSMVTVPYNGSQIFSIDAAEGYEIDQVFVDEAYQGKIDSYTFYNVTDNHTIRATFKQAITYNIVSSAGPGGTISPDGTAAVVQGTNKIYTITPDAGKVISKLAVDGNNVKPVGTYTFTSVTGAHSIYAEFDFQNSGPYKITKTPSTGGIISGDDYIAHNGSALYTINTGVGYKIADVQVDGVSVGTEPTLILRGVVQPHTITATFEEEYPGSTLPVQFTSIHTAEIDGYIAKARYHVSYGLSNLWKAHVRVFDVGTGYTIHDGDYLPDVDIDIKYPIVVGQQIGMTVTTDYPILNRAWTTEFFEAKDDNNWTFIGYADDKLVGMTANDQVWNGPLDELQISNAKRVGDPTPLLYPSAGVGNIKAYGLTISNQFSETTSFRVSISYTYLNRFGPTKVSTPLTFYASKPTSEWSASEFVQVSGKAPNGIGVLAVELYFTEGESQELAFLGRVNVPDIETTTPNEKPWMFNWTGYNVDTASWVIGNIIAPSENYTNGVPASRMNVIDGQLYFWGSSTYPYRIWVGGNPGNRFSVSPGTGGGFVDVEPGTGTSVTDVLKFKTQQGAAIVTALTDNPNSQREARYNLVESSISISNEQSVKGWMAEKIAGAVGCKSENGAIAAGDGLYSVSRYGLAITTLTMEYNSQLQVLYVSDAISPVFTKQYGTQLKASVLLEINGVIYMTFGSPDGTLDNVIFCYDISTKAWWTYTLDIPDPILNMIHVDYENAREGIGIITKSSVFLLPTTIKDPIEELPNHEVLIETGAISTIQPLQTMHYLSQLEFRFDYFIGDVEITVDLIDQFGREIVTKKRITHAEAQHRLAEYIRIDQVVESYKITIRGRANFRLTHYIAKLYPKPMRIGMVYGFDSSQNHRGSSIIRRVFNSYNDLKNAIIP